MMRDIHFVAANTSQLFSDLSFWQFPPGSKIDVFVSPGEPLTHLQNRGTYIMSRSSLACIFLFSPLL
jgi:hypothetical protein